jgi:hypothetical protein
MCRMPTLSRKLPKVFAITAKTTHVWCFSLGKSRLVMTSVVDANPDIARNWDANSIRCGATENGFNSFVKVKR